MRATIIAAEDMAVIFNDAQVAQLAKTAKLPPGADMAALAEGIRDAARIFARDAAIPTGNELHSEIAKLHKAADRHRFDEVATLIENLSPKALKMLIDRGPRRIELPAPDALSDPVRREGVCDAIASLCRSGGQSIEGRRRPSGKRSRAVWRPLLHAPAPRRNFPKRAAERDFVMWLSLAWCEATGAAPSRTARHHDASREVGPFARFAHECLRRVGAPDVDIVELMNELHRRRREAERRTGWRATQIAALPGNNP